MRAKREAAQAPPMGDSPRFAPMWAVVREAIAYLESNAVPTVPATWGRHRDSPGWPLGPITSHERMINFQAEEEYFEAELVIYADGTWQHRVEVNGKRRPMGTGRHVVEQATRILSLNPATRSARLREPATLGVFPFIGTPTEGEWDFWDDHSSVGRYFARHVGERLSPDASGGLVRNDHDFTWMSFAQYVADLLPVR